MNSRRNGKLTPPRKVTFGKRIAGHSDTWVRELQATVTLGKKFAGHSDNQ